jgi:DNA-binding PadR family transcriptional regulator
VPIKLAQEQRVIKYLEKHEGEIVRPSDLHKIVGGKKDSKGGSRVANRMAKLGLLKIDRIHKRLSHVSLAPDYKKKWAIRKGAKAKKKAPKAKKKSGKLRKGGSKERKIPYTYTKLREQIGYCLREEPGYSHKELVDTILGKKDTSASIATNLRRMKADGLVRVVNPHTRHNQYFLTGKGMRVFGAEMKLRPMPDVEKKDLKAQSKDVKWVNKYSGKGLGKNQRAAVRFFHAHPGLTCGDFAKDACIPTGRAGRAIEILEERGSVKVEEGKVFIIGTVEEALGPSAPKKAKVSRAKAVADKPKKVRISGTKPILIGTFDSSDTTFRAIYAPPNKLILERLAGYSAMGEESWVVHKSLASGKDGSKWVVTQLELE